MSIFAADVKFEPFWWEAAPPRARPETALPARVDVAIVGAGYTGLSAALTLARGGREVVVLEAEEPGAGASTRNAGNLSHVLKLSFGELIAKQGLDNAIAFCREAVRARRYVEGLIEGEQLACDFARAGRFVGALTPAHYEGMAAESELFRKHLGIDDAMVPRAEQHHEVGTDAYHGGIVLGDVCAVDPARLTAELLARALGAGATVAARTPVTGVAREGAGFKVETGRGAIAAGAVVIASNGYTGPATPYFRRRLVPILSSMIATEPLAPELLRPLNPKARMIIDSAKLSFYSRLSPDGARFLFGGTGKPEAEPRAIAAMLRRQMVSLYPELEGARISHVWNGQIGYTFDHLPHLGVHDGIHYALGYCGGGLTMGSYLGHKIARRILGAKDAATVFDGRRFPTLPLYRGTPWFMPLVYGYYYWRDRVSRSDRRYAAE